MSNPSNKARRTAVSAIFFFYGLCFASWASRIPSIQQNLGLSEAELGGVLFALPVGLFISLPFSGLFIAKAGSKIVVLISAVMYSGLLLAIGYSQSVLLLTVVLFLFGFFGNMLNISVNTQAVGVEDLYKKKLMATFHGMWSLAGFAGAAIGTFMIGRGIHPFHHYLYICILSIVVIAVSIFYLLKEDVNSDEKRPVFSMPDKSLLNLGIIAFCSMMCEGAMFDWSGVYFKKVVMAEKALIGLGYTAFMVTMAGTRFVADGLSHRFGLRKVLQASGVFTTVGLLVSVVFPSLISAVAGFLLVGIGVSSVVPLVYSAVGKSKTLSPGIALAAVSTLGFLGFLIGPPVIGLIAGVSSLRVSFLLIAMMGLSVAVLSSKTKY